MASFRSGDIEIAYDDLDNGAGGAPLMLVHGFATNRAENWRRLGWYAAAERKGLRVIAPDLRGHGESAKPHDPAAYAREAMAGDLLALLDHLGLRRVDLMGYSMGAHLSLAVALDHPDRVGNLILGGVGERLLTGAALSTTTMTMAQALTADPSTIDDATLRGFRQFADNQGEDRLALAACSEGRGGSATPARLADLRAPTLVVAGARDEIAGDPAALASALPGARSVSLPGCDHFTAIPHALFKAAVFDFLDGWSEAEDDPWSH